MGDWYVCILLLLLGLSLGSFFNVVIYRLPRGQSIVKPRSRCPSCKKTIRWFDNIPVVSYVILKGRCRRCGRSISVRYPLVEILTALLLVGLYFKFGQAIFTLIYGVLFAFLVPIAWIDIDRQIIPDKLTIPGFIMGWVLVSAFHFLNWKSALLGSIGTGAFLWGLGVATKSALKKETLGFGDVKLLVMTGVYLGFPDMFLALFLGALCATVFLFFALCLKRLKTTDRIPFGPFIALGIVIYVFIGDTLVHWYDRVILGAI
ncbi:MAG TPA: prepilin peptidase [bacterium]